MKAYKRDGDCCAKPIKGAMNQPKMTGRVPHIANAVAMQPKASSLSPIKGAVNKPKG